MQPCLFYRKGNKYSRAKRYGSDYGVLNVKVPFVLASGGREIKMNISRKINFVLTFALIGLLLGTRVGARGVLFVLKFFPEKCENIMFFAVPAMIAAATALIYLAAVKPITEVNRFAYALKSVLFIICSVIITLICYSLWVVLSFSVGMRFFY